MLGYFPPERPDEAVYSMAARYKAKRGADPNGTATKRELFGAGAVISIRLPAHLQTLVDQLPPAVSLTVDDLIDHHTLAPSMRPFLTESRMNEVRQRLQGDTLPRAGSRNDQKQRLKYCAACADDDRRLHKEAYWHRLHQSAIVEVCPVHQCWLSYVSDIDRPWETLLPAEAVIPHSQQPNNIEHDNPQHQMTLWLAQQVMWLLDHPKIPITSANLAAAYEQRFNEMGLVTVRRKFNYQRIREEFHRKMSPLIKDFETVCAHFHLNSKRSFYRALHNVDGSPGLHLFLMKFLDIDASSLPAKNNLFHFEAGPWPCLNRACEFFGRSVITQYNIKTDHHGASVASFECGCGFRYSRQAPDVEGLSRNHPHKIVSTGASWNALLAKLWLDKRLLVPQIVAYLSCPKTHVTKMRKKLALPRRVNLTRPVKQQRQPQHMDAFACKRQKSRQTIEGIRASYPGLSRTEIYKLGSLQMGWLYKHDREWLEGVLPKWRKKGPEVDWEARDAALVGTVDSVRRRLIEEDVISSPARISISRLVKHLGIDSRQVSMVRLPLTLHALEKAAESSDDYRVRRLFWLISHSESHVPQTLNHWLSKAEIRLGMRGRQPFADAICKAEELINRKNLSMAAAQPKEATLPISIAA
jgi:hypothetical protein